VKYKRERGKGLIKGGQEDKVTRKQKKNIHGLKSRRDCLFSFSGWATDGELHWGNRGKTGCLHLPNLSGLRSLLAFDKEGGRATRAKS